MRASILLAALFSALAIAAPIARPEAEAWNIVSNLPEVVEGSDSTGKDTSGTLPLPPQKTFTSLTHHSRPISRGEQRQHGSRLQHQRQQIIL